ncbi:MAG: hypothetical protein HRU41_41290 [Saprospiraceae bacterium]|nr:hypothetical protein [Saprospiraceae bacterium]
MKYLALLLGVVLLYLVAIHLRQPGSQAVELIPNTNPSTCICFEYTGAAIGGIGETIYQSCDVAVLDQVGLPGTELTILELPCDSVFTGVKVIEDRAVAKHVLDTINR